MMRVTTKMWSIEVHSPREIGAGDWVEAAVDRAGWCRLIAEVA